MKTQRNDYILQLISDAILRYLDGLSRLGPLGSFEHPVTLAEMRPHLRVPGVNIEKGVVCQAVKYARLHGKALGGNAQGYYIAKTGPELQATIFLLESKVRGTVATIKALQNTADNLLGNSTTPKFPRLRGINESA